MARAITTVLLADGAVLPDQAAIGRRRDADELAPSGWVEASGIGRDGCVSLGGIER
jgi:hypothetical protein